MNVRNASLFGLSALAVAGLVAFKAVQGPAKQASPADHVAYAKDGLQIDIDYCRPYKKGRVIFGGLVPFDEVWRTGANKATTFATNKDLTIGGKKLPAGKYTLWTIPHVGSWEVIFNKKMYNWGINMDGKASREPAEDAVVVSIPVQELPKAVEQFTISVEDPGPVLVLAWDKVKVAVPLK
jgi:hypothetical protein